jgi:hypothetical protein
MTLVYNVKDDFYHIIEEGKTGTPTLNKKEPFTTRKQCIKRVVEKGITLRKEDENQ